NRAAACVLHSLCLLHYFLVFLVTCNTSFNSHVYSCYSILIKALVSKRSFYTVSITSTYLMCAAVVAFSACRFFSEQVILKSSFANKLAACRCAYTFCCPFVGLNFWHW